MNKLKRIRYSASGFTLIELLIVIVIIGILAGVLLTVIDPARQQRKAKETVLRATVEKGCLALHACGGTSTDANNCDEKTEIGVRAVDGTPVGSTYYVNDAVAPTDVDSSANVSTTATVVYRGVLISGTDTCRFQCGYDFTATTGGPVAMSIPAGSVCLIGVQ